VSKVCRKCVESVLKCVKSVFVFVVVLCRSEYKVPTPVQPGTHLMRVTFVVQNPNRFTIIEGLPCFVHVRIEFPAVRGFHAIADEQIVQKLKQQHDDAEINVKNQINATKIRGDAQFLRIQHDEQNEQR
jgi:hypothetical protein